MNEPKSETLQFDVREDEEQTEKLQDIIDLLVAAGYFRARLKGLSAFDKFCFLKVVGGLVWCITLCNRAVDVDLFYSENSTIGQQIALTEKIVEVLPRLKCSYSIEPHQIQGLDCIHIYPVIQWLVREVVKAKENDGDIVRRHAVYQFSKRFKRKTNQDVQSMSVFHRNCKLIKSKCVGQHAYTSEAQLIYSDELNNAEVAKSENYIEANDDIRTSGINNAAQNHQLQLNDAEKELIKLEEENRKLDSAISDLKRIKQQAKEILEAEERINNYETIISSHDQETLDKLRMLLAEHDEIRQRESAFKANCRNELEKLDEELSKYQSVGENQCQQGAQEFSKDAQNEDEKLLVSLRLQVAELNRDFALEHRRLDQSPAKIEISQYQRRIIELYNQTASKHRETKQFYILHNTLIDLKMYLEREIDVLNSIDDVQDLTSQEGYKESFLENLQKIFRGIDSSLDKFSNKQKDLQAKKDKLSDEHHALLEKERLYHRTVEEFKNLCQQNEELKKQLKF